MFSDLFKLYSELIGVCSKYGMAKLMYNDQLNHFLIAGWFYSYESVKTILSSRAVGLIL